MTVIHSALGISTIPSEFQALTLKYFSLQIVVSCIYLSYAWISLYYFDILNSFSIYSFIVAIGMLFGAILDFPLGLLTDRLGQKKAYCGALTCLLLYYLGLIFARSASDLLLLEIIVGIYSALISGSYITWFMNSWEILSFNSTKEPKLQFNTIMSNINSIKTILIAIMTIMGGFLLNKLTIPPQGIFLLQSGIAGVGIILGIKLLNDPHRDYPTNPTISKERSPSKPLTILKKYYSLLQSRYANATVFFLSLSLLGFTSMVFQTLLLPPLLYDLLNPSAVFNTPEIIITYSAISLFLISLVQGGSDFIYAVACRFSGRVFNSVKSPYHVLIVIYSLIYPLVWLLFLFLLSTNFTDLLKFLSIIFIYICRLVVVGLASSLYWQFYSAITTAKYRSSQESLFNTIYLITSTLGFGLVGLVVEKFSIRYSFLILFLVSCIGIILLIVGRFSSDSNEK